MYHRVSFAPSELDGYYDDKLLSFVYIQNKLTRIKFFSYWLNKCSPLFETQSQEVLFKFAKSVNLQVKLTNYFRKWKNKVLLSQIEVTETRLSDSINEINESDPRYQEFFEELKKATVLNARLVTKKTDLDSKIKEISSILEKAESQAYRARKILIDSTNKHEILLKNLSDTKLYYRDMIVEMIAKMGTYKSNLESLSQTSNTGLYNDVQSSISMLQSNMEQFEIKKKGMLARLDGYKEMALGLRRKIFEQKFKSNDVYNNAVDIYNRIVTINDSYKPMPHYVQTFPSEEYEDLVLQADKQLENIYNIIDKQQNQIMENRERINKLKSVRDNILRQL